MKPKLSLVIPCLNAASTVKRLVDSINSQDPSALERTDVVFVDNGSTDGTRAIVETLTNFKVVDCAVPGPGAARNAGVAAASGEYSWFLDADDELADKDALSSVLEGLDAHAGVDCLVIGFRRIDYPGRPPYEFLPNKEAAFEQIANVPVAPWAKVIRRALYVPMPEVIAGPEDCAWWFRQADRFDTAAYLQKVVYLYHADIPTALSRAAEYLNEHPKTLEELAFENTLLRMGLRDKCPSETLRNLADMYDIRNTLTKPHVVQSWARRFRQEVANVMTGHWIH